LPAPRSYGARRSSRQAGSTSGWGSAALRGFTKAVAGAGWVARQRRVVAPEVEARLRMLR
jgi:hypothetical protein